MRWTLAPALLALLLMAGCAGPSRLAQRSEEKLATGDHWRAWELATRALDREPGNPRARAAATAAARAISDDWQRRIRALADVESLTAAEQTLEFSAFRAGAAAYTAVPVEAEWPAREQALRRSAARFHYQRGASDLRSGRPKSAHHHFSQAERFVPGYRDAAVMAHRAFEQALTRVAVVPFLASGRHAPPGHEVAAAWREGLARSLAPPAGRFTRLLGAEAVEGVMTLSQLGRVHRDDAIRLGRKAGAQRVVWGTIGRVDSETELHVFSDHVARRVTEKGPDGRSVTRWVEVPIEVIARVRNVSVQVEYEVISTRDGSSLAYRRDRPATSARVVWTTYLPEGSLEAYALVSEPARTADPERARSVERRWKATCGETTTLQEVLGARRSAGRSERYGRHALPRFIAGAAFVFLEDLPPPEDLALAALAGAWQPLRADLLRLDAVDDVELGVAVTDERP